ncbi:MAG: flagellar hook-basal body complex protein FliE [Methylobacter tundripaludum]|jgi:flagellar hook-basal body complex protein FliE|uniref:Flagellar hook-basal body complex protein FliE n=1 Tax=Methylobacter tundripaludum TaxID=173365 RepID=A0A2S6GXS6_9GAMM|nr:flagellar hook-basal body complex protein FliE [Methylobacter tundripaludum]MCF7966989.1 flagellar hook-basal body complex protein FliE [Methylobacter tundripaludum]MCK9637829.1 flagellar hook-basal body complex protein FliE [Methylobacter tundripaludum]PPK69987.1 flagellar hook-basal body complex protein FliE [Methylobacter tundripaludum]
MSEMNVNQVLAQMRAMSLEAGSAKVQETGGGADFAAMLKQSIGAVNDTQQTAGKMAEAFEQGDTNVSLAEVMVASQKASVSFQAMLQVRNKLVEAYQDVMNMPM